MRIAMAAPLEMRVPPIAYGGTELVVSLLTEELVARGHDVTLFASGDSLTKASLVSVCPRFLRGSDRDARVLNLLNIVSCLERANEFDIIHNHTLLEGLGTAGLVRTPLLSTLHGNLTGDETLLFQRYKGWHNTISRAARALLPRKEGFAGVVYNAIDCSSYPLNCGSRGDYLLFLSRMSEEKGPHFAIEAARASGMRLVMAGNVHPVDAHYFQTRVLSEVDGDQIKYVGEADYCRKRELLAGAYCLLAPITWPEPFGLFMVEAMACGTPVIAFNQGAAPEVVVDGQTGFVVTNLAEMVAAIPRVPMIDGSVCRAHVEHRFDMPIMADGYLAAYQRVLLDKPAFLSPSNPFSPQRCSKQRWTGPDEPSALEAAA